MNLNDPVIVVGGFGLLGSLVATIGLLIGALLKLRQERKAAGQTDLAARFDDASQLAQYIREEVERQVAPIRQEMADVKEESHELRDAFRAWILSVWSWSQRGRTGDIPMPPAGMLAKLGLSHFVDDWPTEPQHPKEDRR